MLGDPIAHSLSPALHRAAYAALGLDWTYDAHRVPAGGLAAFLAGLGAEWRGLSLTMPLKREAMALVDEVTDRARLAGAVNTLVLDERHAGRGQHRPARGGRRDPGAYVAAAGVGRGPGRRRDGDLGRAGAGRARRDLDRPPGA